MAGCSGLTVTALPGLDSIASAGTPLTTTLRKYFTPVKDTPSISPATSSHTSPATQGDKPKVMFTGMIDKKGEKTVKELGGELVDSVYRCTHLVTDKVMLHYIELHNVWVYAGSHSS